MVFTPEPTIMSGGHLLSYDTMHITEFTLMFDLGRDRKGKARPAATNAAHPGLLRRVYRMAMALPQYARNRGQLIICMMCTSSC